MDVKERSGAAARLRCPFCHDALVEADERVACPACGALHHAACLAEARRCGVFGCAALLGLPSLDDARTPAEIAEVFRRRARWYLRAQRARGPVAAPRLRLEPVARAWSVLVAATLLLATLLAFVRP